MVLETGSWFLLVVLVVLVLLFFAPGRRPHNFPPGLPMLPLVGSVVHMRGGPSMELLRSLKNKYGNMASFGIFGTGVVLVSGVTTMKQVFSNMGSTGTPDLIFTTTRNYIISKGRDTNIGILGSSGQKWQEQRRFIMRHLRDLGFGKTSYEPMMVDEVKEMMDHIQQQKGKPIVMKRFFHRSVLNVLWGMVMGKRYSYDDAKLTKILENFAEAADFNMLDIMLFVPGMTKAIVYIPFLKDILKSFIDTKQFLEDEIQNLKANEDSISYNSLASVYLREIKNRNNEQSNFNMDQMTAVIFEMFFGGMETTSTTLTMALYLLGKHPTVQERLHQELDEVVGRDRLPNFSDMDKLPYTIATIHEVQRTFNLTPFSLLHAALEDCTLAGYHIPKGTVLMANIDDAMSDPHLWKNPRDFDPGNFLDSRGKFVKNEAFLAFGIGKRQCAGESLARQELFLFFSCLLQRFSFCVMEEEAAPTHNPTFNAPPKYTTVARLRSPV